MDDIAQIRDRLLAEVSAAVDLDGLERVRLAALGKKGALTERLKGLRDLAPEERQAAGVGLNTVKGEVTAAIGARRQELAEVLH